MANISRREHIEIHLGGKPDYEYVIAGRGDACIIHHPGTFDTAVAIRRLEKAIKKLKKEYGIG